MKYLLAIPLFLLGLSFTSTTYAWEREHHLIRAGDRATELNYLPDPIFKDEDERFNCKALNIDCPKDYLLKKNVEEKIYRQAEEYGVDDEIAYNIAVCESGLNSYAKNPNSMAKGVYQFLDGTWDWIKANGHQFDFKENIHQFMVWYLIFSNWWTECL